jgi:hypothetical protein
LQDLLLSGWWSKLSSFLAMFFEERVRNVFVLHPSEQFVLMVCSSHTMSYYNRSFHSLRGVCDFTDEKNIESTSRSHEIGRHSVRIRIFNGAVTAFATRP